ncbi:hypothetical protein BDR26DRAFT_937574 [Obelidium mucronatum]|nr:hypothetical protein BDR26DRAFT_937574 [Obelidium mucronatum]
MSGVNATRLPVLGRQPSKQVLLPFENVVPVSFYPKVDETENAIPTLGNTDTSSTPTRNATLAIPTLGNTDTFATPTRNATLSITPTAIRKRNACANMSAAEKISHQAKEALRVRTLCENQTPAAAAARKEADRKQHQQKYENDMLSERHKHVYSVSELEEIDACLDFGLKSQPDILRSLQVEASRQNSLDPLLVSQYDISQYDPRLARLFLSQYGFYYLAYNLYHPVRFRDDKLLSETMPGQHVVVPQDDLFLAICPDCYSSTRPKSHKMPADAIANENWIGRLPETFGEISRTTENVVSLMQPCIYLSSPFGFDSAENHGKMIKSHHYVLKNSKPVLRHVPADIGSTLRFTFVGAWTSAEMAEQKTRYQAQDCVWDLLEFLEEHHLAYKKHEELINSTPPDSGFGEVFADRSLNSDSPVNEKLCRLMQNSSYNTGTASSATEESTIHNVQSPSTPEFHSSSASTNPTAEPTEDYAPCLLVKEVQLQIDPCTSVFHVGFSVAADFMVVSLPVIGAFLNFVTTTLQQIKLSPSSIYQCVSLKANTCPYPDCDGVLEALPIPGEAYQRLRVGKKICATSKCQNCMKEFYHKDVMMERVRQFAKERNIDISPTAVDEFRCAPPSKNFEMSGKE